jgi:hypothetical protein
LTTSTTSTTPNLSFNASNTGFAIGATVAGNYLQSIFQNKSGTAGASTNYVVSNDLGTDSTYYGEFGMNSSVFSASTPADFFSINNGIYFSGHDGDISIGSGNGFKTYLAWGTAGQSAHVINASGALGFSTNLGTTSALSGTTGYGTAGQVPISAGSSSPVSWSSIKTINGTSILGSGNVPVGKVLQTVQVTSAASFSTASTTDVSTGLNASITPLFNTSKILVIITANCRATAAGGNCYFVPSVYRNTSTQIWTGYAQGGNFTSTDFRSPACVVYLDSPATTSSTNYLFALNSVLATGASMNNGGGTSTITLMEIAA